ncbi:MAG: DUF5009 domain-containing protein [Candidatus Hydrogenedentes bacterium]|nr:DUF5009 domain-containing protein [Candidatus Hydrogenedentota bacterium]
MQEEIAPSEERHVPKAERVVSVDVLRGFDMFWIVGGGALVEALSKLGDNPVLRFAVFQLSHCEWEGCVFYDVIFPLFVFMVGAAIVFSLGRMEEKAGMGAVYRRILRRTLLLFFLGLIYYGGVAQGWDHVRLLGVLQRIALCYGVTAILFCTLSTRKLIAVFVGILLVYWAWLSFIPVPGLGKTSFAMGENWPSYIDSQFLPLRRYNGTWDPEGIMSTLPAIGTCLLGVFAGLFIKNPKVPAEKKGYYFLAAAFACLVVGYLWGFQFPIIKKIWTSSYVLVAGGYSLLLLAIFYQIIDVWKVRGWITPFLWIGSNALVVYMAWNLIDFEEIAARFAGGPIHDSLGAAGDLGVTAVSLAFVLLLARFLYNKKIFIRI